MSEEALVLMLIPTIEPTVIVASSTTGHQKATTIYLPGKKVIKGGINMDKKLNNLLKLSIITTVLMVGVSAIYYFVYFLPHQTSQVAETNAVQKSRQNSSNAFNKSSKEYARLGSAVVGAFQCSVWSGQIGKQEESDRLFLYGYEKGKIFMEAAKAEKITQEDYKTEVPLILTWHLSGPSVDFALGQIYDSLSKDAIDKTLYTGSEFNSDETKKIMAQNKYSEGNCQLIGK